MKKNYIFLFSVFLLSIFSLINFVYAYSWDSNLNNGLIGYWGMNEGNGSNIAEEVSGINNLTINGNVTWKSGIIGDSTGDYSLVGDRATPSDVNAYNLNSTENFSISFWMYTPSVTSGGYYQIIGKIVDASPGWAVTRLGNDTTIHMMTLWNSNYRRITFSNVVTAGNWQHFIVTYNGNKECSGWKLYLNNTEISSSCDSAGTVDSLVTSTPFAIGGWWSSGGGIWNAQPNARMDEVGIWNRVLNNSEILQLYNNGNGITYTNNFTTNTTNVTNPLGAIQWENESILNVNSSQWWNFMDDFNSTHFVTVLNKLTISESWLSSFITSLINYNYITNLGFYPASNPSNFYNVSTLPKQTGISFAYYNITTSDKVQTSNSANINILSLPLNAGKTVSIECTLFIDSDKNSEIQLNSAVSGTSSRRQIIEYYNHEKSQSVCSGTNENLQCFISDSEKIISSPTRISIYTVQSTNGFFKLDLKNKKFGKEVYVRAGSWCRSIES